MNSEQIKSYELKNSITIGSINENEAYTLGKNPTIYKKKVMKDPDNRIPIPLAKSAVEDMSGYAASVGSITVDWVGDIDESEVDKIKREEYVTLNKNIYQFNDANLETSELYTQALTQGEAYELFYVSDEMKLSNGIMTPEFAMVDNKEIELVYGTSIKPKLEAAIRFWGDSDVQHADVYYPLYSEAWKKIIEDKKKKEAVWVRDIERDTVYPYTSVPLAVYKINRQSDPLFEAQKAIIDSNDNLISKSANEIDRFNALIALFPGKVDQGFINKLVEDKIIDELDQYEMLPQYLEKSLSNIEGFYNTLADRLEKAYHKTIKVPDFSDENFAGNSSGIAIAYKLMGLEFKASQIEAYFNRGLIQRDDLISQVLNSGTLNFEDYDMTIKSQRNIPIDEKSKTEIVKNLYGVVSNETLLKFLPNTIISDVELELEKLDEQNGIDLDTVTPEE